jgi:hypothetical protein
VLSEANRKKIDDWVNEAPDFRKIESEPLANDAWETRALEDGQIVYEEVDLDTDQPILNRLAAWCEEHLKPAAKPPVKTTGAASERPRLAFGRSER